MLCHIVLNYQSDYCSEWVAASLEAASIQTTENSFIVKHQSAGAVCVKTEVCVRGKVYAVR